MSVLFGVCDCFQNISLISYFFSCQMVFPNIQYLTFDLKSKQSSTPIWNIMFKSICFRQQFQSLYVMLLSFHPHPFYIVTVCGEVFTATDCGLAEVQKWNVENPKKGKHVWLHGLLCFSVLKWKPTHTSAKAVAILRKGTVGTTCIIYEVDTHSSFNLWATSTQSLCH